MKLFFSLFNFFINFLFIAQVGCVDPQATNFDPSAVQNDGSCVYGLTNYSTTVVSFLPESLQESSALLWYDNKLLSLNDSGGQNVLLALDTLGQVLSYFTLANAVNVDWEGMAISDSLLYVGDFGNNSGTRQDLAFYAFSLNGIQQEDDTLIAQRLLFKYEDQVEFTPQPSTTNFDAEAVVFYQDSIHIFSKSWGSFYCKHYVLPSTWQDTAQAQLRDSIYLNGLVTDASIDKESGRLILLGYKLDTPSDGGAFYSCFSNLLFDYPAHNFFKGNNRRIDLGGVLSLGQTEGITWTSASKGFITSEKITSPIVIAPRLRSFDFNLFFTNDITEVYQIDSDSYNLIFEGSAVKIISDATSANVYNSMGAEIDLVKIPGGWLLPKRSIGIHYLAIDNHVYKIYFTEN
jgi:hypothetical protein